MHLRVYCGNVKMSVACYIDNSLTLLESATVSCTIVQITISYRERHHNRIKTPDSPFSDADDPTG